MQIRTKTAIALIVIFVTLLAGAWIIMERSVRQGFDRLEAEDLARDRTRVQANLDNMGADLRARVLDYARWDDTYAYFQGRMPPYPSDNFQPDWFHNYRVDFVVLMDANGSVRQVIGVDGVDQSIADTIRGQLNLPVSDSEARLGVAWTSLGPVMFAGARTTGSDNNRRPLGWIILGSRLSEFALRRQAQLELHLISADAAGSLAPRIDALRRGQPQIWDDPATAYALIPLRAADGGLVGVVSAQRARDISALGAHTIAIAIGLFTFMAAIAMIALWWVLRQLVISRIVRLQRHFDAQSSDPKPLAVAGDDEIARLTTAYNELVRRMRDSYEREHEAVLAREAAASANRMKSDFLANISHELRMPLNAVIGYSELIEEELTERGFDQSNADLRSITNAARRLVGLIDEILDLSKIEASRLEIRPETFTVEDLLQGTLEGVGPSVKDFNVTFDVSKKNDLGAIYSDQHRLRQCLAHVLLHACRLGENAKVFLRVERVAGPHELIRFEVQNTGASMSEQQLARAFEPFVETDAFMSRRFGGTGLGLAIARKLIGLLGGVLEGSTTPGQGCTFVLIVPTLIDDQGAPALEPARTIAA